MSRALSRRATSSQDTAPRCRPFCPARRNRLRRAARFEWTRLRQDPCPHGPDLSGRQPRLHAVVIQGLDLRKVFRGEQRDHLPRLRPRVLRVCDEQHAGEDE